MSIAEMDAIALKKSTENHQEEKISKLPKPEKKILENGRFFYEVGLFKLILEDSIKVENLYDKTINKAPHVPDWCSGITSIRGIIMPVVNMHVFLKTDIDIDVKKQKLIMLEHENNPPIVFAIDRLPEMMFLNNYNYEKSPENAPVWLNKTLRNKENTIYEINHLELLKQLKNSGHN